MSTTRTARQDRTLRIEGALAPRPTRRRGAHELLAVELFSCLAEAQVPIEDWRQDYNEHRPHSALGMMAPAVFARGYRAYLASAPASAELRSPSGLAPFDAGGTLTLQSPTNHQLSQQVDR